MATSPSEQASAPGVLPTRMRELTWHRVLAALQRAIGALRTSAAMRRWQASLRPDTAQRHLSDARSDEQAADTLGKLAEG